MNDRLALQVELFADLMVRVDDPFGARGPALAEAGLDEDGYRHLVDAWRGRIDGDDTRALGERFACAYASRRAALHEARRRQQGGEAPRSVEAPRFLDAGVQSFREEAAGVGREPLRDAAPPLRGAPEAPPVREAPSPPFALPQVVPVHPTLAGTADISAFVPRVALPFTMAPARALPPMPAPGGDRATAVLPPEPSPQQGGTRGPHPFAMTADISAAVARAATPFPVAPAAVAPTAVPPPAEAAPRRRLIRFDPQTGLPLPALMWVDLPPEPGRTK